MDTFWSVKFIGLLWIVARINGLPLGENSRIRPELTRSDNGVVFLRSDEDFTGSEMVDQTTISIETTTKPQNGDVEILEVPNDNEAEMSVSITQMPIQVLPLPSSNESENVGSSSEMLTTIITLSSEERETTMTSTMVNLPTTQVTVKSEPSEETTTLATLDVAGSMMTTIMAIEAESTLAPTTMPTENPMKTETIEKVTEFMMTTKMATDLESTSTPMKIESNEVTTSAIKETTEIMVTTKITDKPESNMVDIPTTNIPMKSESTETKWTETSTPSPTTLATIEMTTKIPDDQNTILTTVATNQPHIESTSKKMEHEQSTKYQSSTAELVKEQTTDATIKKSSENSSHQMVISNLIWISILLIIFG